MTGYLPQSLPQLLLGQPFQIDREVPALSITGIVLDSRKVQKDNLFVALEGDTVDGHRFIPHAVQNGAAVVIGSKPWQDYGVPYFQVKDSRLALAYISAAFYRNPGRNLVVVGVTGTDGKTTTANLIYQIMLSAGLHAGIISTVNATIGDVVLDTGLHVTTPEAPDVQRYLARMVTAGLSHVVIEVTSHGLAQNRVTGCEFDVGVVTNVTHEHLDYHGSYQAYLETKGRLLTSLDETHAKKHGNPRAAVLNKDDGSFEYLSKIAPAARLTYSQNQENAELYADDILDTPDGLRFTAISPGFNFPVESRLVGKFNISNCLAAIGAAVSVLNLPVEAAQSGIAGMHGVPGRMERIDLGQDFTAIVDFAHTPNALRRALEAVREISGINKEPLPGGQPTKVIAVFGSAGLRDRQKRRMMAEVSADLADFSILTAEDPRSESLSSILEEMAQGASSHGGVEGKTFWRIPDRGEALRFAIRLAKPGDLVIACGKGHEQSMCFGEKEYPWDDRTAMKAALAEWMGIPGPEMPFLPTRH